MFMNSPKFLIAADLRLRRPRQAGLMAALEIEHSMNCHFTALSHTLASLLENSGASQAVVMELAGRRPEQMSSHYTRIALLELGHLSRRLDRPFLQYLLRSS
jgi:hypothetical protein